MRTSGPGSVGGATPAGAVECLNGFTALRALGSLNDAQLTPSVCRRFLTASRRVCPESSPRIADFSREFSIYGGLKNRRLHERKSSIRQVLISRTLTVCGEVAERLKAAVC